MCFLNAAAYGMIEYIWIMHDIMHMLNITKIQMMILHN